MKIVSSFTLPQVVPNLYECVCSAEHKGRYSEECGKQSSSGAPLTSIVLFFPTMEVNGVPEQPCYKLSSKYLPLCCSTSVQSTVNKTIMEHVQKHGCFCVFVIVTHTVMIAYTEIRCTGERHK